MCISTILCVCMCGLDVNHWVELDIPKACISRPKSASTFWGRKGFVSNFGSDAVHTGILPNFEAACRTNREAVTRGW